MASDKNKKENVKEELMKQFIKYSRDGVQAPKISEVPPPFFRKIKYHFGNWTEAVKQSGLRPNVVFGSDGEWPWAVNRASVREDQILDYGGDSSKVDSICWKCRRATNKEGLDCSWAGSLVLPDKAFVIRSEAGFKVIRCEDFIQDEERTKRGR